jgi:hypothetical protein
MKESKGQILPKRFEHSQLASVQTAPFPINPFVSELKLLRDPLHCLIHILPTIER